jgi:S1-C subfamily serine protease
VVISSDGKILSQMSVIENGDLVKEKIKARFDDGTVIPLKLIEEAGQGWSVLLPELPIHVNHYFELSTSEVQLQDEVRVWGPEDSPFLSESLAPFGNTVTALDRKYPALGIAVWQLRFSRRPVLGTPILDADGDLLGMTITGAQDLLLAIPVAELKAMFPKSLGLLTDTEKPAEPAPIP